jgi:F0F1-type ATP synthase membrane subunit b/b'
VKVAEAQLRAEVANASVKLAEELVREALSFDDERRLAREFVAGFDEPAGPGGAVS